MLILYLKKLPTVKYFLSIDLMYIKIVNFNDSFVLGPSGIYILEGLQPKITYDFRFGAKNQVGFSQWGASQQFTMPQRGPPEAPNVNTLVST